MPLLQARIIVADLDARAFTLDVELVQALGGGYIEADAQFIIGIFSCPTPTLLEIHPCKLLDSAPAAEPAVAPAPADQSGNRSRQGAGTKRIFMIFAAVLVVAALITLDVVLDHGWRRSRPTMPT